MRLILNTPFQSTNIKSYGLMVHAINTDKWLTVQRRHSVAYMIYMSGGYRLSQVGIMFSNMTEEEVNKIATMTPEEYNTEYKSLQYSAGLEYSKHRHIQSKHIAENHKVFSELEWTWPKGQAHNRETQIQTAIREFEEEAQTKLPQGNIRKKMTTNIKGLFGKTITTTCWVYDVEEQFDTFTSKSNTEIVDCMWVNSQDLGCHLTLGQPIPPENENIK